MPINDTAPFFLDDSNNEFPHPSLAATNENYDGLLAIGGDLSTERLLNAYRAGIFPWYNEPPIFWWSPDPRLVLFPHKLHCSRSLQKTIKQQRFRVSFDNAFAAVIQACSEPRIVDGEPEDDTWITDEMKNAYIDLHELGFAHSVEVWDDSGEVSQLAGGLYGVALGKVFFGESMFMRVANASKVGFVTLINMLAEQGFELIDCQVETQHLRSLGAELISRADFLNHLTAHIHDDDLQIPQTKWRIHTPLTL